jgi:streptomycin 6-kinase
MLADMTASQILEWQAYNELEPIGKGRDDYRTALLCSLIANIFKDKNSKPAKLTDFLLQWDKPIKRKKWQTVEEAKNLLQLFFRKKK